MESTVEPDLLLCISPDNQMLHVGPASEVLPHVALSATVDPQARAAPAPSPLEVYDVEGRRIPPDRLQQLADSGAAAARRAAGGFDDPDRFLPVRGRERESRRTLLRRINESLDFAQAYLREHPVAGNQGPGIPAATEVPRPRGTYAEVLQALSAQLAPLDPNVQSNRGNWFHNLWHNANGTF
jgi:hypothetical protein